jgi:hypothetical protein
MNENQEVSVETVMELYDQELARLNKQLILISAQLIEVTKKYNELIQVQNKPSNSEPTAPALVESK